MGHNKHVHWLVRLILDCLGFNFFFFFNFFAGRLVGHFGIGNLIAADPPVNSPVLNYVGRYRSN